MKKPKIGNHLNKKTINDLINVLLPNDGEFLVFLITDYIRTTTERVRILKDALAESDSEKILFTSHAHSGTSGIIGAHQMQLVCHEIEVKVKNDRTADINDLIQSLNKIALETETDLHHIIRYIKKSKSDS